MDRNIRFLSKLDKLLALFFILFPLPFPLFCLCGLKPSSRAEVFPNNERVARLVRAASFGDSINCSRVQLA